MADIIGSSPSFIYLRLKVPRTTYDGFVRRFGGVTYTLRELRLAWQSMLTTMESSAPPETRDASGSSLRSP